MNMKRPPEVQEANVIFSVSVWTTSYEGAVVCLMNRIVSRFVKPLSLFTITAELGGYSAGIDGYSVWNY